MRCWCVVLGLVAGCGFSPPATAVIGDGGSGMGSDAGSGSAGSGMRSLTIDLGNTNDDLVGFTILVTLDASRVDYADVPDPRHGFMFTDQSGGLLDYDVDHWNPSGTSALWVRLPPVPANAKPTITMKYGSGMPAADTFATWGGFTQVLHFDTLPLGDSAGGSYPPSANAMVAAAPDGQIGTAGGFVNGGQVSFANSQMLYDHWSSFTLGFWMYANYAPGTTGASPVVLNRGGGIANGTIIETLPLPQFAVTFNFDGGTSPTFTPTLAFTFRQWTYFAYTYDGDTLRAYVNGLELESDGLVGSRLALDNTDVFTLGAQLNGSIDEFELDQAERPGDWIGAQYKSQTDQAITFSP